MRKYLTDKLGRKYTLKVIEDSKDLYWIELYQKGDFAGHAKFPYFQSNIWKDGDIYIRDDSDPAENIMGSLMKPIKAISYRRCGLGTALLKFIFKCAGERQITSIYGYAVKKDVAKTPWLLKWYFKHGFESCAPYSAATKDVVAWICKKL